METKDIEQAIVTLTTDTPAERFGEVRGFVDRLKEICREFDHLWESAATEHIHTTGEDLVIGTVRWYLGTKKKISGKAAKAAILDAILALAGGDMEAAARDFMASEPFKHGAIRKALADNPVANFDDLFTTEEETELREGVPTKKQKSLQRIDDRFIR